MFCGFFVGIVGEVDDADKSAKYIWTHKKIDIGYNGKQIVDVNLTSEHKVKLELDGAVEFSYEVRVIKPKSDFTFFSLELLDYKSDFTGKLESIDSEV